MSWNYHVPYQEDFADRNPRTKEDAVFDKLDATGVLHVVQRAIATEAEMAAAVQFQDDQKIFLTMYPVYKDTDRNAQLMKHHWENAIGVVYPTLEQLEESFFALRASGVLQLDEKQVAKEDAEAVLRRAAEIREKREANAFDEENAYALPFDELERRARG